ncbi:MAG: hypothetical protein NT159_21700 [Proteobacteria bacterium]|nr:hypothetical protein [Pseudomonadota bacterium]
MADQSDIDVRTLDEAIEECSSYISENRKSARLLLVGLLQLGLLAVMGAAYLFVFLPRFEGASQSTLMTSVVSGILILVSILLGVLVSLYRFHLLEIARTEHYKIGFLRIRVAANNTSKGFGTEVRRALTDGAFIYESSKPARPGRVDSPMPGHPTSDISTTLINRVLDGIDISLKPKAARGPRDGN